MRSLRDQINEVSQMRDTRDLVIDYFKQEYPGKSVQKNGRVIEEWKGKLVGALEATALDKNGKPYKRASLQRRFETGRETSKVSAKQKAEYKAVGALLPPIPPDGGYVVSGTIHIRYSRTCEEREIEDIYITGEAARLFAETADIQIVINLYNDMDAEDPEGYAPCDSESDRLTVDAA